MVTTTSTWTVGIEFPSFDGDPIKAEFALTAMLEACQKNQTPPISASACYEGHLTVYLTFTEFNVCESIARHAHRAILEYEKWAKRHGINQY